MSKPISDRQTQPRHSSYASVAHPILASYHPQHSTHKNKVVGVCGPKTVDHWEWPMQVVEDALLPPI